MMKQLALFLALGSTALALELTPDNWDAETEGKTVFIKFFAPWCGHCKAMAKDWETLMGDFAGSTTQLVAEVDCTAAGEDLCSMYGVEGFPTIKYGDPSDLQDYQGPREYDELKAFADENLKPTCSVDNIDLCEGEKKELIEKYLKMSEDELQKMLSEKEQEIADLEQNFEVEMEKLQETYEGLQQEMEATQRKVKASGLSMMKSILKSKVVPESK